MKNIDKYRGCLIGGTAGDVLGYAIEFYDEGRIFKRYGAYHEEVWESKYIYKSYPEISEYSGHHDTVVRLKGNRDSGN